MSRKADWDKAELTGVYAIGECYAPMIIADAVFYGHRLAREMDGPNPQRPQPYVRERQFWRHETFPKLPEHSIQG
jgi:dimethylamine/trimethylamine dehydrogenase